MIDLVDNDIMFTAIIGSPCLDSDCDGCCSANAIDGFLVSVEYYTVLYYFGGYNSSDADILFKIEK